MSVLAMANDDHRRPTYQSSPPIGLGGLPHVYPHSHHGSPAQEYSGFAFHPAQLPMEPNSFRAVLHQRPMPPPLIMPQWPSQLNSQTHSAPGFQQIYTHTVQPLQPLSGGPLATPVSAISAASSRSASTPRKTLTDVDRRRMCQYAEDHPNSKQTEIGSIFGVERSTVSKVLRQKEKYLQSEEGRRSPVKRSKGRSPDIERALVAWARNQEKKGVPLTDELIRDSARKFQALSPSSDNNYLSSTWIEKFKLNHNLMGARSRKGSIAPDDAEGTSTALSTSQTPSGTSPISPQSSPKELHAVMSHESLRGGSPDSYIDFGGRMGAFHSQSTTSLNSAFTDTAPSSFSPGPLSPNSPFFTPDSGTAASPFVQSLTARPILATAAISSSAPRPRSQTFPTLDAFMTGAVDVQTPKYIPTSMLDSPIEEPPDPILSIGQAITVPDHQPQLGPHTVTPAQMMRPPPLPQHVLETKRSPPPLQPQPAMEMKREPTAISPATTPAPPIKSAEDARAALEALMNYFEAQPDGLLSFQESVNMGKIMDKLTLRATGTSTSTTESKAT